MEIILNFTRREQTSYGAGLQSKTFVANKLLAAIWGDDVTVSLCWLNIRSRN